jgi:hypothetical protein
MSFLAPGVLWAFSLLLIPILIHLFSFRKYRTVYFPDVRFLRQVQEETATRNKLKQLLILIARMLAITFLVLAFAQPFIPSGEVDTQVSSNAVSIYLDNSFSMMAEKNGVLLLDDAKRQAQEIVDAYGVDDVFQLITNTPDAGIQKWMSKEEMTNAIARVQASARVMYTDEALKQQFDMLQRSKTGAGRAFQVSDFQQSSTRAINDTIFPVTLVQMGNQQSGNMSLDSAWWSSPVQVAGEPSELVFRVTNYGTENRSNAGVTLRVNNQVKGLQNLDIPAGETVEDTIGFVVSGEGWQEASLSIEDYPVQFDDVLYVSFRPVSNIRVICINFEGDDKEIYPLYTNKIFTYLSIASGNVDYNSLSQYDLIILNQVNGLATGLQSSLMTALGAGSSVTMIPGSRMDLAQVNTFLAEAAGVSYVPNTFPKKVAGKVHMQHPVFEGVFEQLPENLSLPYLEGGYLVEKSVQSKQDPLISFNDGTAFISSASAKSGQLYLFPSALDKRFTDLVFQGAVFVPMMYRMALLSQGSASPYLVAGQEQWVRLFQKTVMGEDAVWRVQVDNREFIPAVRRINDHAEISLFPYAEEAGFYRIQTQPEEQLLALNFDRRESNLLCYDKAGLEQLYGQRTTIIDAGDETISAAVNRIREGQPLWKICIIFTLIFLAVEILLIRLLP